MCNIVYVWVYVCAYMNVCVCECVCVCVCQFACLHAFVCVSAWEFDKNRLSRSSCASCVSNTLQHDLSKVLFTVCRPGSKKRKQLTSIESGSD